MTAPPQPPATSPGAQRRLDAAVGWESRCGPRPRNEDYVGAFFGRPAVGVVAALADGVSNSRGGRVAAELAVRGFIEGYVGEVATRGVKQVGGRSLQAVNRWIHAMGRLDPELAGMATTLTALVLRGRVAHVLHVGDSRLYCLRGDKLVRLTTDHVLGAFDSRHMLTRAVGSAPDVMVDYTSEPLQTNDRFLLCSDGVHGVLSDRAIIEHMRVDAAPAAIAASLTDAACAANTSDNATALVVDVKSLPEPNLTDVESALAALPIKPPPGLGDVVDGFRMDRLVADGIYTRVFKATDLSRRTEVLAKFPKARVADDAVLRQAFLRENWIAALVRSPWIGEGSVREQSQLFSVMPWYHGETLEARLARQPPLGSAPGIGIAIKLVKGMAALHRCGIIHRDIKPENVILETGGGLRLIDLGVARIPQLEDFPDEAAPGTSNYMAPELFAGARGDERSDIFAVGVTIFRLFTGALPYSEAEAFARPSFRLAAPLAVRRPDLPGWLGPLLARAYAAKPEERPRDAIELLFDLENGQLRGGDLPALAQPLYQRDPVLVWKLVSAALLIALALSLAVRPGARIAAERQGHQPQVQPFPWLEKPADRRGRKAGEISGSAAP